MATSTHAETCTLTLTYLLSSNASFLSNRYTFLKVLPGNYDITASHPSWTLEKVWPPELSASLHRRQSIVKCALAIVTI